MHHSQLKSCLFEASVKRVGKKMRRKEVLILLCIFHIQNMRVHGDDFFTTMGARFQCFPIQVPEDCNEDFTEAYPELSRSVRNDTLADTYFYFFTRKNPDVPEPLHKCGGKLPKGTNFNPENEFKIYIQPFFINVCDTAIAREMKDQLLERDDYNVMLVDDSWAMSFDASSGIANVELIGKQVATVLQNIQDQTGIAYDKIHIITHSLGAQVASAVGKHFKLYRITGLDPAQPAFPESLSIDRRLDPTDAEIVEVVHCDAEPCLPNLGITYDAGDFNFYMNDGRRQYSCYTYFLKSIIKGDIKYAIASLLPQVCSHLQCLQYFKVSINPKDNQFVGVECDSYEDFVSGKCSSCGKKGQKCAIMGLDFVKYSPGAFRNDKKKRYYVDTSLTCPYMDNSRINLRGYKETFEASLQDK